MEVITRVKKILIIIGVSLVLLAIAFFAGYYTSATVNAGEITQIRNEYDQQNRIITSRIAESQRAVEQLEQRNRELEKLYNGITVSLDGIEQDTRGRIEILNRLLSEETD